MDRLVRHLPLAAGPLALLGFVLPWAHGPGRLGSETYSGLDMVRLAEVLRAMQLPLVFEGGLVTLRLALVAVPVAATWLTLLAPRLRWHWAYRAGATYIVVAALALAIVIAISEPGVPLTGAVLMFVSACTIAGPLLRTAAKQLPIPRLAEARPGA